MSLLDQIMGKESIQEMTTTGSMGTTMVMGTPAVPGMGGAPRKKKKKKPVKESVPVPGTIAAHQLKKNLARVNGKKEKVKESLLDTLMGRRRINESDTEDEDELDKEEIIPDDAEPALGTGVMHPEMMDTEEDTADNVQEPLMDPSIALVAPDVTPGAFQTLSVDKVEQSKNLPPKPAPPAPEAATSAPTGSVENPNASDSDAMKTLLGQMGAMGAPVPESAQEAPPAFTPSRAGMTGDDLLGQGAEMPAPVQGQGGKIWENFGRLHSAVVTKAR